MSDPTYVFPLIEAPTPPSGDDVVQTESAIQSARKLMQLWTSNGTYLDAIGQNLGIPRPDLAPDDDALYTRIIEVLAWQPKTILFTTYALMAAVFGSQASLVALGERPWKIYEVNANEFIVEVPYDLTAASNANASYLHGAAGYGAVTSGPSNTFTTEGDVTQASGVTLAGQTLYFLETSGWTAYTITSATYDAATDISTVVVGASTLPDGGGYFYILVSGDGTDSYRGDYLANSGCVTVYSTTGSVDTDTLLVRGDVMPFCEAGTVVKIGFTSDIEDRVVSSATYDVNTNVTTVVITTTDVPGGLTGEAFVVELEEAGTATTAPPSDRVYLTGMGLFEVVEFYMNLLVRASGVVMRFVQI